MCLTQCSLVYKLQSSSFHTNQAMIAYIISLLSGKALVWATAVWDQQPPSCSSILAFIGGRDATSQVFNIFQGARPMADLAIQFSTLAAENGWNTEALVTAFHQGLSKAIKDELTS